MSNALKYFFGLNKRFIADARGSVLIFFALAAIVLILAAGVAIDISRGQALQTRMQVAIDAGGFSGGSKAMEDLAQYQAANAQYGSQTSPANAAVASELPNDVQGEATKYFHTHLPNGAYATGVAPSTATLNADGTVITLNSNTQQNTNFVGAAGGAGNMGVSADSTVRIPPYCGTFQDEQCLTGVYNGDDSIQPINLPGTHTWTCVSQDCGIASPLCTHTDPKCNSNNRVDESCTYGIYDSSVGDDGGAPTTPGNHKWTCISKAGLSSPAPFNTTGHVCVHQDPGNRAVPTFDNQCDYGNPINESVIPDPNQGVPGTSCDVTHKWSCFTDITSVEYTHIDRNAGVRDCHGTCNGSDTKDCHWGRGDSCYLANEDCDGACHSGAFYDTCHVCQSAGSTTGCTGSCDSCGQCGGDDSEIVCGQCWGRLDCAGACNTSYIDYRTNKCVHY